MITDLTHVSPFQLQPKKILRPVSQIIQGTRFSNFDFSLGDENKVEVVLTGDAQERQEKRSYLKEESQWACYKCGCMIKPWDVMSHGISLCSKCDREESIREIVEKKSSNETPWRRFSYNDRTQRILNSFLRCY